MNRKNIGKTQSGFALVAVMVTLMIVTIMAIGGMRQAENGETLAGSGIQRSRSFQAADGASLVAETQLEVLLKQHVFSDTFGSDGVYARNSREDDWWRNDTGNNNDPSGNPAVFEVDAATVMGVVAPPTYVIEETGQYVTDGGTGVASLDIGGASYGRKSASGREVVLYSVESHGKGSFNDVESLIETIVVLSH